MPPRENRNHNISQHQIVRRLNQDDVESISSNSNSSQQDDVESISSNSNNNRRLSDIIRMLEWVRWVRPFFPNSNNNQVDNGADPQININALLDDQGLIAKNQCDARLK